MIKMKKQTFVLTIIGVILATLLAACGGYYVFTGAKDVVLVQASDYEELQDMSERYGKLYAMQNTITGEISLGDRRGCPDGRHV